jgi:hypothetical protein
VTATTNNVSYFSSSLSSTPTGARVLGTGQTDRRQSQTSRDRQFPHLRAGLPQAGSRQLAPTVWGTPCTTQPVARLACRSFA